MRKTRFFSVYVLFTLTSFFANGADVLSVSNEFPSDGFMQENYIYKNAAVFENLGAYSGIIYARAKYEDIPRYCESGYYMPENSDECVICDENHYCLGGADAIAQHCPDGLYSPAGTISADNCGKILRVGEHSIYITQHEPEIKPALAVRLDNKIYYAKMTPVSEGIETTSPLRALVDNVEYSIHDNIIQGESND